MKTTIAFIYDFDKTLSPKDMQEYSFLEDIGVKPKDFWQEVGKEVKEQHSDSIITYMQLMIEKAIAKNKANHLTKKSLKDKGKDIILFKGVEEWFSAINQYAKSKSVNIEHYIVSAGNKEIIEGTKIANEFKKIYGCSFRFDENDIAKSAGLSINYTNKTQFLFRINKGHLDESKHDEINRFTPEDERPIPFHNMVYFGDGDTDVPCMKLVKEKGGYAIAVYPPKKTKEKVKRLLSDNRINFYFPADYSKDKELFETCKTIIDKMITTQQLINLEKKQKAELEKQKTNAP